MGQVLIRGRMAYTCRGCGTQIAPNSFNKCPVCGIRLN